MKLNVSEKQKGLKDAGKAAYEPNSKTPSRRIEIAREFRFEAAHRLPQVPATHKCSRLHGHSYRFEVRLSGEASQESGWLRDFKDISDLVQPLVDTHLDHYYLNAVSGLENPTSENLAIWLWTRIKPHLSELTQITVYETCTSRCIYSG